MLRWAGWTLESSPITHPPDSRRRTPIMTLREELDARLAEFDLRSAQAKTRAAGIHDEWNRLQAAYQSRHTSRFRWVFGRCRPV